jgi:hypothetical protein
MKTATGTFSITATDEVAIISFEFPFRNSPQRVASIMSQLIGEIARIDNRPIHSFAAELRQNREIVKAIDSITWVLSYRFANPDFPRELVRVLTPFAILENTRPN